MTEYLLYLLVYALGFLSGAVVLILMAFWRDMLNWFDDLRWKFKTGRFR